MMNLGKVGRDLFECRDRSRFPPGMKDRKGKRKSNCIGKCRPFCSATLRSGSALE
jgi:hypothetical protein